MLSAAQEKFLIDSATAAQAARHIWPKMAACEAALESSWGASELYVKARNAFGQKQQIHPIYGTLHIPTKEFINHQWVTQDAAWIEFPDLASCFKSRMDTLERLKDDYPHYALALEAKDADTYIKEVSLSWSTDPARAAKVSVIYHVHQDILTKALGA